MAKLISVKIDVTKIDKSKLFKGAKGTYCDLTFSVNDTKDNYGNDCSIYLAQSKEEREKKQPKVFIGNGKTFWTNDSQHLQQPVGASPQLPPVGTAPQMPPVDDDLPF